MIAIPNMDKPKKGEVIAFDGENAVYTDDRMNVHRCPLIDIVTCEECKWWNEETHGCNRNPSVGAWWESDFCSYGERRSE